jgi:hypothetical protein
MFSFCPHCGELVQQEQRPGEVLFCQRCGREIGQVPVAAAPRPQAVSLPESAARCPACGQVVEVRHTAGGRTLVPHYQAGSRRICPNSGKAAPAVSAASLPSTGPAALARWRRREVLRLACCRRDGSPQVEEIVLEYLAPGDRQILQQETLKQLLGDPYSLHPYPISWGQHLGVWRSVTACVVAQRGPGGELQSLSENELSQVLAELAQQRAAFFS